jgi:hypothetical protein
MRGFSELKNLNMNLPKNLSEKWGNLRLELQGSISSSEGGIDVESIRNFMTSMALPAADLYFVDKKNWQTILKTFKSYNYGFEWVKNTSTYGAYFAEIHTAIVKRFVLNEEGNSLEQINGPSLVAGIGVHEMAHGSSNLQRCELSPEQTVAQKFGFKKSLENESSIGEFLEEGFVEMLKARFLRQKLSEQTGGISKDEVLVDSYNGTKIPKVYSFKNSSQQDMLFFVSIAGYSFELLCQRYPEMFDKVLEARRKALGNNGLREIFEEFCPGLFEKLNKFSRDIDSYVVGLKATEEYLKQ